MRLSAGLGCPHDPIHVPVQVITDLKGSDYSWSYQTPPSSPSSSSSRKSSMCRSAGDWAGGREKEWGRPPRSASGIALWPQNSCNCCTIKESRENALALQGRH